MLVGHNLAKSYGRDIALKRGDHSVRPGEISAVLGLNGSGKSTLHRLLGLIDEPSAGSVELDGLPLFPTHNGDKIVSPWPAVTLVFQGLHLWPHLTLRQNIQLPLRRQTIRQQKDLVDECVSLFRMEGFIERYPNQVSGGERQRAALARAFALRPKYLLLDECAALDVEQRALLVDHLLELRRRGIGISMITHWIGFARQHADWITVLDRGETVEAGPRRIIEESRSKVFHQLLELYSRSGG